MHNDKLVQITEKTKLRLLKHEVILPSTYLEIFMEEMKKADDQQQEKSTHSVVAGDDEIMNTMQSLKKMEHHLFETERDYVKEMNVLRSAMDTLRTQLFSDDISKSKNRLWIFKEKLNNNEAFNDHGFLVSIKISDYDRIISEYDTNIGNRLLKQVSDYMIGYLNQKHCHYEIVRYSADNFLIFMHELNEDEVEKYISNMQNEMSNYDFKHHSRVFSLTFNTAVMQYMENESFSSVLGQLDEKLFENSL
ncbi:diguanylate cyclase [Sulfurovum sp. XGS-02]|uniref:diguanylate cyclase domain-containing protein n=1 Tax=Sulfurovum sp. XGS-02 TaxID=2925411 RepID=UPI0020466DDD|nr:diguanylate cyclase [Sulfurovum sp. XGS-02]UPT78587.1 diguanylate cyclase [Sulfurovum sp. XGS-02]